MSSDRCNDSDVLKRSDIESLIQSVMLWSIINGEMNSLSPVLRHMTVRKHSAKTTPKQSFLC